MSNRLTYRQRINLAHRFANHLIKRGVYDQRRLFKIIASEIALDDATILAIIHRVKCS